MGLLQRTTEIFAANLNTFVDRFEDPQKMLQHALRQMEDLLAATSASVARSIASERLLEKTRAAQAADAERWRARAAQGVAAGDDALARRAIAAQLEHERAVQGIDDQLNGVRATNAKLRRQLDALVDRHAAARTKLAVLAAEQTTAEAQRQIVATNLVPTHARAVARFERFVHQLEFAAAEAMALAELETRDDATSESQFDEQTRERAIDAMLAQLKQPACD